MITFFFCDTHNTVVYNHLSCPKEINCDQTHIIVVFHIIIEHIGEVTYFKEILRLYDASIFKIM